MRYTGVVRKIQIVSSFPELPSNIKDLELDVIGFSVEGKHRDCEGNEEWRTSKVFIQ